MKSARRAAWRALTALERGRSTRVDDALDRAGLSAPDRALALELARGVERMRLVLDTAIGAFVARPPKDPQMKTLLRLGAYQLMFLTRVPAYAAVGETVGLLQRQRGFANGVLRNMARAVHVATAGAPPTRDELPIAGGRVLRLPEAVLPDPESDPLAYGSRTEGVPEFLVRRWAAAWDVETALRIARASASAPSTVLRARVDDPEAERLTAALQAEGVETEPTDHPRLLRWTGGRSPFGGDAFSQGLFVVQDPTAVRAAEAVAPSDGAVVVDLCAGPGTKTSLLAELVGPAGHVHAYDVSEKRRAPIVETAERLGLADRVTVHEDVGTLPPADAVLVDVPCSNTGVLARRVEVRRRLRESVFAELAATQRELLERALGLVATTGGTVVYSTCSVDPEENDGVVDAVVRPPFEVVRRELTLPDAGRCDGGYFAVVSGPGVS